MKEYKVEKVWTHKDNICVVVMSTMGHRCGYVGIPLDHPLYGCNYNDNCPKLSHYLTKLKEFEIGKRGIIPIMCWDGKKVSPEILLDVHGGVTYSGGEKDYPIENEGLWWFGYDCAHLGDAKDLTIVSDTIREIEERFPQQGVVRSLEYCILECESLSNQLQSIGEDFKL